MVSEIVRLGGAGVNAPHSEKGLFDPKGAKFLAEMHKNHQEHSYYRDCCELQYGNLHRGIPPSIVFQ